MTRTLALFCILGALLFAVLLNMLVLPPGSAAQEPEPRPSPTPEPWIQLTPDRGVAEQDLQVLVTGIVWPYPGSVILTWERADGALLGGPVEVAPNGEFAASIVIPAAWATPGAHYVVAVHSLGNSSAASLLFDPSTPTDTPTPSPTPSPSTTPSRTPTASPTLSPTPSRTPTPTRTLRPVTPDVTKTPQPAAPGGQAPATTVPGPVVPTSTETPTATPSATPMFMPLASATPTGTATPTATASPTATPSRTAEATPTFPPVPRQTRDPGQQLSQLGGTTQPAALVEASPPEATAAPAGSSWQSGFFAALILLSLLIVLVLLILATLFVAWRIRQMRRAERGL